MRADPVASLRLRRRAPRAGGFSLVELTVAAALVALLLLISGQLFVELIRQQATLGQALADTGSLVPFDDALVRDAQEGRPIDEVAGITSSAKTLLLLLPAVTPGEERVARWELDAPGGVERTIFRAGTAEPPHLYPTSLVVSWELDSDLSRERIIVRGYESAPKAGTPARMVRVICVRNS